MKTRRMLLEKLFEADIVYWMEGAIECNQPIDYKEIYHNVLWLEKELDIVRVEEELRNSGKDGIEYDKSFLTFRQYHCYTHSMAKIYDKRFGSAYHEICDFISNYNHSVDKPISNLEKNLLGMWIRTFKYAYNTGDHKEVIWLDIKTMKSEESS